MCIGTPMQVLEATAGQALAEGRGRTEKLDTRLVGDCRRGDWLLVFQGAARDRLDAGLAGDAAAAQADAGFTLPSAMSAEQLAALSGHPYRDPQQ